MSQPPHTASPLTARLYDLEYPRSLGVYSTYQEVQSVVDTLADNQFPVQSTLIVGTDLKLMERVTGRKTWGRVVGQGVLSGLWMGLFLGLLLMLITPSNVMVILTSILMGIVFFTVWAVIGYAMTGGRRDFTSMTATIPMQYELLVEHKHADQARRLLAETGASPAAAPQSPATALPGHGGQTPPAAGYGQSWQSPQQPSPQQPSPQHPGPGQAAGPPSGSQQPDAQQPGSPQPGGRSRPTYGQPAPAAAPQPTAEGRSRSGRPSFGQPAGTPMHGQSMQGESVQGEAGSGQAPQTQAASGEEYGVPQPDAGQFDAAGGRGYGQFDADRPPEHGQEAQENQERGSSER
ncbi:general stress protein [Brachybacterium sp. GCM10030267]|uniref:general stress protein n=1 Tax=unclassified Brachybacterium TaxID=2623841 RepID=UPI00361A5B35